MRTQAEERAEDRILDALLPRRASAACGWSEEAQAEPPRRQSPEATTRARNCASSCAPASSTSARSSSRPRATSASTSWRRPAWRRWGSSCGRCSRRSPAQAQKRKLTIRAARPLLIEEEAGKLVNEDEIRQAAIEACEQNGIVFIDEIDKVASARKAGAGVCREGVQRDLLPLVEGSTVSTKYGAVKTDHILFIASGAFHVAKPSDLIPELQGRFPIRVELTALSGRLQPHPDRAQGGVDQAVLALLETEGVTLGSRAERSSGSPRSPPRSTSARRTSARGGCLRCSSACSTRSATRRRTGAATGRQHRARLRRRAPGRAGAGRGPEPLHPRPQLGHCRVDAANPACALVPAQPVTCALWSDLVAMHAASDPVRIRTALVVGANGFLGGYIASSLRRHGWRVLRGVRPSARPPHDDERSCDLTQMDTPQAWHAALAGVDAVVNAAGILRQVGTQRFEAVHVTAPLALAQACVARGIAALRADLRTRRTGEMARFIASKHRFDEALLALAYGMCCAAALGGLCRELGSGLWYIVTPPIGGVPWLANRYQDTVAGQSSPSLWRTWGTCSCLCAAGSEAPCGIDQVGGTSKYMTLHHDQHARPCWAGGSRASAWCACPSSLVARIGLGRWERRGRGLVGHTMWRMLRRGKSTTRTGCAAFVDGTWASRRVRSTTVSAMDRSQAQAIVGRRTGTSSCRCCESRSCRGGCRPRSPVGSRTGSA